MPFEITRQDGEDYRDFHARAATGRAVYNQKQDHARRESLAKILRVEGHQIAEIIDLAPVDTDDDTYATGDGTYVVQTRVRFGGRFDGTDKLMWTAVVGGKSDHTLFYDRRRAILHALGREVDVDINVARHLVEAAARVLTLPDTDPK